MRSYDQIIRPLEDARHSLYHPVKLQIMEIKNFGFLRAWLFHQTQGAAATIHKRVSLVDITPSLGLGVPGSIPAANQTKHCLL